MLELFKRVITFIELIIAVFLPCKLRSKYSEFLLKLECVAVPPNFASRIIEDKQRNFEKKSPFRSFLRKRR